MKSEKLEYPVAILSDVNGNLEALEAVLADIKIQKVKSILFLGDAIGFGPNPAECLDLLRDHVNVYLLGRLETLMLEQHYKDSVAPPRDQQVLDWPSTILKDCPEPKKGRVRRIEWLSSRPDAIKFESICAFYMPPHLSGVFLYPPVESERYKPDLAKYFNASQLLILSGNKIPWYSSMNSREPHTVKNTKTIRVHTMAPAIVSVGSVGQPRDMNSKSCYVIATADELQWRRVAYDVEKTVAKIRANIHLSPLSAARLLKGA